MSPLIIAQFIMCGICLAIGLLHLAIYGRMPDRRADLFFALMCFSTAAGAFFEGLTYQASTIDGYNSVYRFQVNAQALQAQAQSEHSPLSRISAQCTAHGDSAISSTTLCPALRAATGRSKPCAGAAGQGGSSVIRPTGLALQPLT